MAMKRKEDIIRLDEQDDLPVYENNNSDKVIIFAKKGLGMSEHWWKETHRARNNGSLYGIYKTPSGLRRTLN